MTLIVAGMSVNGPTLKRAKRWLCSRMAEQHNNSYWVVGAIGAFPDLEDDVVQREVRTLESVLRAGAKPNPQQLLESYYLRVLAVTRSVGDPEIVEKSERQIKSVYTKNKGWFARADTTTDGYAILYEIDTSFAASIKPDVVSFLDLQATSDGERVHWGSVVSTSYTIMNIVACDLWDEAPIQELVMKAVRWLRSQQRDDGSWVSDMPYGGAGDIKSPDYPTAVVARALLAYVDRTEPPLRQRLFGEWLTSTTTVSRRRGIWILVLFFLLTLAVLTPVHEWIVGNLSRFGQRNWGSTLDRVAALVGIGLAVVGILLTWNADYWKLQARRLGRTALSVVPWSRLKG